MNNRVLRRGRLLAVAALLTLLLQGRASAGALGLVTGTPDITAFSLNFTFDSGGNACGAGAAYTLCYSGMSPISSFGLSPEISDIVPYQLLAAIDPVSGLLTGGGTFMIGEYLTGTVTGFGYTFAGGVAVLEFLVAITGGTLAPMFGPVLGVTGSIFDWGDATFGNTPFTVNSADAYTDNFALGGDPPAPIPEPASLCLLGLGLFALSAARRRQRR